MGVLAAVLALSLLLPGAAAWSQAASLEEIALKACSLNPQVLKAERAAARARRDLAANVALRDSSLSLQGGYQGVQSGISGSSGENGLHGQASLNAPLLEQLSVGGSVSAHQGEALQGEVSVSIRPFAAGAQTYARELA